jgi:hypothetical protein
MKITDCVHFRDLPNGHVTVNSPAFSLERTAFCLADAARDVRVAIRSAIANGVKPLAGSTDSELRKLGFRNLMMLEIELD